MSVRFYKMVWLVFAAAAALTYLTGKMTAIVAVAYGHMVFGLIFMGMMIVLPTGIKHPEPARSGPGLLKRSFGLLQSFRGRVHESGKSLIPPRGVEVRHPKFH